MTGLLTEVGDVLEADHYVVAAGAWSAGLLAGTVPGIAVKPVRGQMILFHAPEVQLPSILLHAGHYVIPVATVIFCAGPRWRTLVLTRRRRWRPAGN